MKILILEDEQRNAMRLIRLLNDIDTTFIIEGPLTNIKEAVDFFQSGKTTDLILADIRLTDGLSFEALKYAPATVPIIFTTAYDEYAVQAFKFNSFDYLLKPLDADELEAAIDKATKAGKNYADENLRQLFDSLQKNQFRYRERFLLPYRDGYKTVRVSDINHIETENKTVYLRLNNGTSEVVNMSMDEQAGGNMEGKETRFGIAASSTWAAFTTAASNGSVNSMHDSYTPLAGMVTMLLMQLGEVIFGGVGCGLYGMLAFAILTVFIAGLMVGRTPEFLGKKIEPYEMKWSVLVCLATPIAILVGSGLAAVVPSVMDSLHNGGAHGFSEMLYTYSSCGGNNGSAFAGFNGNTVFLNVSLGLVMLFARFLPIIGTLAIAGSLAGKKKIATTAGTLSTTNGMFVFLLIVVVLLIGALSFFPALALGPLAEFFGSIA